MRWIDKPALSAASMTCFQGSHRLSGPPPPSCTLPVRGLVGGFGSALASDPVRGVGGFEISGSEPVCGLVGGFESAPCRYRRTAERSTFSSRAILRLDQPC